MRWRGGSTRAWTRRGARTRTRWAGSAARCASWRWRSRRQRELAARGLQETADLARDRVRLARELPPGDAVDDVARQVQVGVALRILLTAVPVPLLAVELDDEDRPGEVGVDEVAVDQDVPV